MKYLILFITTLAITSLVMFVFALKALGGEELNGQLHVDFPKEEAVYTESHSFDMSASVPENSCNYCIKNFNPSQCLEACEDIIIKE